MSDKSARSSDNHKKSWIELASEYGLEELMEEEAFMATQWILWYYSNPDKQVSRQQ